MVSQEESGRELLLNGAVGEAMPDITCGTPKQARVRTFEALEGQCSALEGDREGGPPLQSREEGNGGERRRAVQEESVAGEFCLQTRHNILEDGLLERITADFEEMLSPCGGKFTEVRQRQYAAGGVYDLGSRVYIVPEEHFAAMATVMSPRSNKEANSAIIHSTAIEWFEDLMEALARNAWDIFYSQWVETVRFDEGDEAAEEMINELDQLDLLSVERKARVLTHQLASLTLLAYSKSLAEHKDAPMFGHTIGAVTIEGEGELTLRPAFPGKVVELRQSKGDFYSFCCSYRDNATHGAAVVSPPRVVTPPPDKRCRLSPSDDGAASSSSASSSPLPPALPSTPTSSHQKRVKKKRWALLVRMWLPGRVRYVRMKGERCQFRGYRRLGSERGDQDEETKSSSFVDLQLAPNDPALATPDYSSLRAVLPSQAVLHV